ncbi:PAS domain S-box protein [Tundrisphaera sp. TA3]|uniref:PAS domain S-box protein n=1 Tax=Tundrisphaera sp. TA3 TaxID=3435775 RepID=UPI003EB93E3E
MDVCTTSCRITALPAPAAMPAALGDLFSTEGFPARWSCGAWPSWLGWLHIASDLAIFAAYTSIPIALGYFMCRRRRFPFPGLTALYASFILACGIGHGLEALIFWHPVYRLAGAVKAITALVSWATVIATVRIIPTALKLPDLARSEMALRRSEERFALAARGTDHGIWDWDMATGVTYYSPRYRELLGCMGGDFDGKPEDRLHPEDRDAALSAIVAHLDRRSPYDVEYRLRTRDGDYRWFHARGQAVWDDDGRPSRMVGSIADIDDRKRQEAVIAEQVRIAEFVRDVALALTEDATLPEMLRRCAEAAVCRLDAAFSRVWIPDESGEMLELRASAGMYTHIDGPHARVPVGRFKIGTIASERRPLLTNSVVGDPAVPEQAWAEREGMVSFAGFPLIVGDRLIGVWATFSRREQSPEVFAAMESVARGLALGIERKRSEAALLRSEAEAKKLALVAARTDNAVILTDPHGKIEWVNDGFTRITGYEPAEVIGRSPGAILQGPGTSPEAVAYMRARLRSGEGFRTEILNYTKGGQAYWIAVEAQPIRDAEGRIIHFMAIEADVTERKMAEEALRRSEERFGLAVRGTNEGLWDWDVAGDTVYFSPRFAEFLGREGGEFEGTLEEWSSRLHPDDRGRVLGLLAEHFETRAPYDVEYRLRGDGGDYRWFHARGQAVWDEQGRPVRMAGSIGDITERKRTEQQLRLLQAAVENANDVILITEAEPIDQPGPRVVYANPAFEKSTGYACEEIIGKTPRMLQGPGTDRATLDGLRERLGRWQPTRVELLNYTKDGREFWVELNIRPVSDASGWYTHWVSIQRDITQRKRAEQEHRARAEGEVRDLNAQLERRILRLDALRQIDLAISASLDLPLTLGIVLDQVKAQLHADAAAILLVDPHNRTLIYAAGKGFRTDRIAASVVRHGQGLAGAAALEQRPVSAPDISRPEAGFERADLLADEGFVSYHAVPLTAKGQVRGVLEVYHRSAFEPDRDWLSFLETLAGQAAIAADNATLFRDLQRSHTNLMAAYDATIEGWARAIDLRDKETEGHSRRVTEMTVMLARAMGVDEGDLLSIRRGAMLHDIGKLGIPDDILLKPGRLTDAEWAIMRRHPEYAYEWLAPVAFLRPALDIPHHHHEKWDGTGYPGGLKGEMIPLAARIFAAVDIWDALRSDRPYRAGWPEARVIDHIRSLSGSHLDPAVVEAFLAIIGGESAPAAAPKAIGRDEPRGEARTVMLEYQVQQAREAYRILEDQKADQSRELDRLMRLAHTDDLTGLNNRRHFRQSLESAFSLACRDSRPLSVVLLDLDGFKSFNDEHGHQAGDELLMALASILRDAIRPQDSLARYGGEEFAVLLPDTDAAAGRAIAERLRSAIADHPWPRRRVTASLGVATLTPYVLSASELIAAADAALYHSKRNGRDRVSHNEEVEEFALTFGA